MRSSINHLSTRHLTQRRKASRGGFTLVELLAVMIASTVLLLSLASTVILSTRLLETPPEDRQQWHDQEIADRLAADLRYATNIDEMQTYGFDVVKPNAVSGNSETVRYEAYIDGLTRQIDNGPVIALDNDAPGHLFAIDGYTAPTYTAPSNAVRVRSSSTASTSSDATSLQTNLPPGCKDGDLLIWVVAARTPWFLIVPSDWQYVDYLYPGDLSMRVMYKFYNSSSPGPVSAVVIPSSGMSSAIVAIENADTSYPIVWSSHATGTASTSSASTQPTPLEPTSQANHTLNLQVFAAAGDPWYDGGLGIASFTDVVQISGADGSSTYGNTIAISARTGLTPDLSITPRALHLSSGVWAQVGIQVGAAP